MPRPFRTVLVALALPCLVLAAPAGSADPADASDWTARKCALYKEAWAHVISGDTLEGISAEFLTTHDDFLASGCTRRAVCPRSKAEIALADLLSLMAVAEGMAGSFLPFTCDAPQAGSKGSDE